MNWMKEMWRTPSADEVMRKQLREAEVTRLEAAVQREYYAAMEKMLGERVQRLQEVLNGNP